jgi:hypothetical protein
LGCNFTTIGPELSQEKSHITLEELREKHPYHPGKITLEKWGK